MFYSDLIGVFQTELCGFKYGPSEGKNWKIAHQELIFASTCQKLILINKNG